MEIETERGRDKKAMREKGRERKRKREMGRKGEKKAERETAKEGGGGRLCY